MEKVQHWQNGITAGHTLQQRESSELQGVQHKDWRVGTGNASRGQQASRTHMAGHRRDGPKMHKASHEKRQAKLDSISDRQGGTRSLDDSAPEQALRLRALRNFARAGGAPGLAWSDTDKGTSVLERLRRRSKASSWTESDTRSMKPEHTSPNDNIEGPACTRL